MLMTNSIIYCVVMTQSSKITQNIGDIITLFFSALLFSHIYMLAKVSLPSTSPRYSPTSHIPLPLSPLPNPLSFTDLQKIGAAQTHQPNTAYKVRIRPGTYHHIKAGQGDPVRQKGSKK